VGEMDILYIAILVLVCGGLGGIFYLLVSGKTKELKVFIAMLVSFITTLVFVYLGKKEKVITDSNNTIKDSKANDENRDDIVNKIDEKIESNKGLIDEIKNILNNNSSSDG
jgi:mannitol-specific phosphotransferase system IIBC component